jgi:hypothetical protein
MEAELIGDRLFRDGEKYHLDILGVCLETSTLEPS